MRPKIVVVVLVVAIGLVALVAVLKGMTGKHSDQEARVPEPPPGEVNPPAPPAPPVAVTPTNAAVLEQLRVTEVGKQLDQIRELQADGTANPATTSILLTKVTHQEPEVRKAALQALVQLDDTNAIPGLEQAQALVEDPHEKVAFIDAIEFLKLPSVIPQETGATLKPDEAFGPSSRVPTPRAKRGAGNQGQPGAPSPAPTSPPAGQNQSQPAPTSPDAAPPQ